MFFPMFVFAAALAVPSDNPALRFAASEFAKYHEAVTGTRDFPRVRISCDEKAFPGGTDAYRIRSVGDGVEIVGKNGRSAIYGVYDFFSRRCGCRWFWDGDVVPKAAGIDFGGLDVIEVSRFEYRACQYFAHRSLKRFQPELWGFDDWKREIDWALKRRLNVLMLQTGIEDLFQLAFPDVVPYPDISKTAPSDAAPGYNLRTPFWSLQFRHRLRKAVLDYMAERGLRHPTVIGPRTHWYSRTPKEFLEAFKPEPLTQEVEHYSEPSGRVWDVRQKKWRDMYWKLTEASIANYGYSGLLFNPGLDERRLFTNREENVKAKIEILENFHREAAERYPDAKVLLEGWDLFGQWTPEEVRRLIAVADPNRLVIWNFTSDEDAVSGGAGVPRHNNFTQWGVVNRFPYVFGAMLELNRASDIRFNLSQVRAREKSIRDDPMCKGYVLWPEAAHTDSFAWWYFGESCWKLTDGSEDELVRRFCRDRYGERTEEFAGLWQKTLSFTQKSGWERLFTDSMLEWYMADGYTVKRNVERRWVGAKAVLGERYAEIPAREIFDELSRIDWSGDFVRRDTLDIARTTLARLMDRDFEDMMALYYRLKRGEPVLDEFERTASRVRDAMRAFVDVLGLHADFSVTETLDAIARVEPLRNPRAEHLLFENSACQYCRGFQFEYAKGMFLPLAEELTSLLVKRAKAGDFSPLPSPTDYRAKLRALDHPILSFAPDRTKRTKAEYQRVMRFCRKVCR